MNSPSDDELNAAAVKAIRNLDEILNLDDSRFGGRGRRPQAEGSRPVGKTTEPPANWRHAALCRTVDRDFFDIPSVGLAGQRTHMRIEIAICQECPSQNPCLDYAMETRQPSGLWGGLLPKERSRLRQKQTRMANQLRKATDASMSYLR